MNNFSHVPPGFRFHPTDEELVDYYLRKKIASKRIDLNVIKDVDLYKIEPWDLEEICKMGTEEQNDWYFFSHKDKKYPTGTRTNRATRAGFWKATGRDKAIYTKNCLIGMRKTLVFYKGRAPNGQKSDWIMHEYRLETNENGTSQEEGWVVCRVFKKRIAATTRDETLCWYGDQLSFMPDFESPRRFSQPNHYTSHIHHPHSSCKQEPPPAMQYNMHHDAFLQLPPLESPKLPQLMNDPNAVAVQSSSFSLDEHQQHGHRIPVDQVTTDWRVLDKFVASQLSQGDGGGNEEAEYSKGQSLQVAEDLNLMMDDDNEDDSKTQEMTSPLDMWK